MHHIKINVSSHGQLTAASCFQIHSLFKKIGGTLGEKVAAAALPQIEREIQKHVASHNRPIRFMRIADLYAKPKPANSPLRLASGFPPPPDLIMRPVESSNLRRVGYRQDGHTLRIEFKTGGVWDYLQVPPADYEKLMKAESPGGYFHSHIRNRFQSRKIL